MPRRRRARRAELAAPGPGNCRYLPQRRPRDFVTEVGQERRGPTLQHPLCEYGSDASGDLRQTADTRRKITLHSVAQNDAGATTAHDAADGNGSGHASSWAARHAAGRAALSRFDASRCCTASGSTPPGAVPPDALGGVPPESPGGIPPLDPMAMGGICREFLDHDQPMELFPGINARVLGVDARCFVAGACTYSTYEPG